MAGPSKVQFPGQKKQRMRARGTKRASEGVLKRLEKNLAALLEDPHARMPTIAYTIKRARKDPVQRSLKECAKVIAKKNDRKWLSKRMSRNRGDGVARALAGSLHAAHDDERSMVAVFNHPIFGSSSFVRRGKGKPTQLVSFQNFVNPRQRLLTWEDHARSGWWFFSIDDGIVCTGNDPLPPEGWIEGGLEDAPLKFTQQEGVYCSPNASPDLSDAVHLIVDGDRVVLSEGDLAGVDEEESVPRSIALRMLPPRLVDFADVEWSWRPEGWPEDKELPIDTKEKVDEVIDAWLNLSLTDSKLFKTLRTTLCRNLSEGCIIGEKWWPMSDLDGMLDSIGGSDPEKEALQLVFTEALKSGGLHVRGDGTFEELEGDVLRLDETSCHANLVALWPDWGDLILEDIYGITGEDAEQIIEKQTKRKQGFGAFLKKMDAERTEHLLMAKFPWKEGDMDGLCGRADALVRKARIDGVGGTISMAKKGRDSMDKALGWAWINVHERAESEGWHFDSDARDKGGDWVPALKALYEASGILVDGGSSTDYVEAMKAFATRSGASDFVEHGG
ncbi:MAG: hypothetical protein CMB52_01775 [Euryarchaeota archaeon]|nr:hypothetical protein [Euryarchaeota archaeon]|tara:strand:+ start:1040 stop:2719 length:1680 start_codon:yes stop_codon:yes gene_type:complete